MLRTAKGEMMQLQEGSTVAVNCAKCGNERFPITLLPGRQKITCKSYSNWATVVEITKDRDGNLTINTWAE